MHRSLLRKGVICWYLFINMHCFSWWLVLLICRHYILVYSRYPNNIPCFGTTFTRLLECSPILCLRPATTNVRFYLRVQSTISQLWFANGWASNRRQVNTCYKADQVVWRIWRHYAAANTLIWSCYEQYDVAFCFCQRLRSGRVYSIVSIWSTLPKFIDELDNGIIRVLPSAVVGNNAMRCSWMVFRQTSIRFDFMPKTLSTHCHGKHLCLKNI